MGQRWKLHLSKSETLRIAPCLTLVFISLSIRTAVYTPRRPSYVAAFLTQKERDHIRDLFRSPRPWNRVVGSRIAGSTAPNSTIHWSIDATSVNSRQLHRR